MAGLFAALALLAAAAPSSSLAVERLVVEPATSAPAARMGEAPSPGDAVWSHLPSEPEARISTYDGEGSTTTRTIWYVVVDGQLFVRAVRLASWGRHLEWDARATFEVAGQSYGVRATEIDDPKTIARMEEAVSEKYGSANAWARFVRIALGGVRIFRLRPIGRALSGGS